MSDQILQAAKTMKSASNNNTSSEDMISNLPDFLLHDIMSHIQVRDAVKMSLLSTRWKNIWTNMSCLYIDFDQLKQHELNQFIDFIDTMLSRREISLHKLHISCIYNHYNHNCAAIKRWICYVVQHHVKVLKIDARSCTALPMCVFKCESLEELHFVLGIQEYFDGSAIRLPRLKKLYLSFDGILLHNGNLEKLVTSCTVLEHLHLDKTPNDTFSISSQSLKYLTISFNYRGYIESIFTPNLVHFCYSGETYLVGSDCMHMPSVRHVEIAIFDAFYAYEYRCKILGPLSNVTKLHLCIRKCIQAHWVRYFPSLANLKELSICGALNAFDVMQLLSLQQQLPNLKKLTFWLSCSKCCLHHNKIIEMQKFFDMLRNLVKWKSEQGKCGGLIVVEIILSNINDDDRWKFDTFLQEMKNPNLQVILSHS